MFQDDRVVPSVYGNISWTKIFVALFSGIILHITPVPIYLSLGRHWQTNKRASVWWKVEALKGSQEWLSGGSC